MISNAKSKRNELKFIISKPAAEILKMRLKPFVTNDKYSTTENNTYKIKSLYFDDIYNSAYYDKIDGVNEREKFRIRIYNDDDNFIRLEKKEKRFGLTFKTQTTISKQEYEDIINDNYNDITNIKNELLKELLIKKKLNNLKPSVIVEYDRYALNGMVEDLRITFDENIKTQRFHTNLLKNTSLNFAVLNKDEIVLEIKFNDYIPQHILAIINSIPSIRIAVSKFALCCESKEV